MLEKDSRPADSVLALDIGGANLKVADGLGFVRSQPFALWRMPERLSESLRELLTASPPAQTIAATMTGELADCFVTKAEGVRAIVKSLVEAAAGRDVQIYLTDGTFATSDDATERPLLAAASNWHALARFAGRMVPGERGLLLDVGSTTCDVIPIVCGRPAAKGKTDPERLANGELVYTGVERSPVCAVVETIPWRGRSCPVAQELFATTWDAYLTLGLMPEEPASTHTADGRPATRAAAHDRLARAICADRTMFDADDARRTARTIADAQCAQIAAAIRQVMDGAEWKPNDVLTVVVSGQGEFLARAAIEQALPGRTVVSLNERLGAEVSRVAPAYALAVLAREAITSGR
jgi:probable H4MPT-linked C1 transfer pathway protein